MTKLPEIPQDGASQDEAFARLDASEPRLYTSNPDTRRRQIAESVLPKGRSLMPAKRANYDAYSGMLSGSLGGAGGNGSSLYQMQRPYFPEIEDPSRQQYPHDRRRSNAIWRMFYKLDPVFGNAVEMYADMLVSSFDIAIPKDAGSGIKETLEYMCDKCKILEVLKHIVIEYLVLGESLPHLFFSDELGIWNYCGFHDPDYVEVMDAPLINMDPILTFEPDDNLRTLLSGTTPESQEIRRKFPAEFVQKVMARQAIRLAPTNVSLIARKLHPYESRGTSLASRLWRIFEVEDAVYRSTIATFRRTAAPIRAFKLGDASRGWIPSPEREAKFMEMLAQCENDPAAAIVWNYGVQYEAWGANERATTIRGELDTIERVKLQALGIAKGMLDGSSNFASAKSSLQVFLRRLLSLRQYIEAVWLMPKFFRPIAEINDWVKTTDSTDADTHTIKRVASARSQETQYILPEIKWSNQLDPQVDGDLLNAYGTLEKVFGIKLSKSTVCAAVGMDFDTEQDRELEEFKREQNKKTQVLGPALTKLHDEPPKASGGAAAGGAPGSGAKPPAPGGGNAKNTTPDASHPPGSGDSSAAGALSETVEPAGNDTMAV